MTTFKTFRSVYGVVISCGVLMLPCLVLGERDERKPVLAAQTDREPLGPNGTARALGHAENAANIMQLMDIPSFPTVTSGKRFDDQESFDKSKGCDQESFDHCAKVAGCTWIAADFFGSCEDDCTWRSCDSTKQMCMHQADKACKWDETAPDGAKCQRTVQCIEKDFDKGSKYIKYLKSAKEICSNNGITTDRCTCWHWDTVNALGSAPGYVCKLCGMCQGEPYEDYDVFFQDCIKPAMQKQLLEQQQEQEKQKIRDLYEKEENYKRGRQAFIGKCGWK